VFDLVIRGGRLVDGSGAPERVADVAVAGGIVAEVGRGLGPGRREIGADGLLVTPGFVDIHTHYDAQATWDRQLTPSAWHGVTTAVFGNCGVGFAPVSRGAEGYLINLMEGVEDIPEAVLAKGIEFRWQSFEDYLDVLAEMPRTMDVAAQVPHGALRFHVMGERGADHAAVPTAAEIVRMGALLERALRAGALGFTTSRTIKHRARDGRPTPGLSAGEAELLGLAAAMRRAGAGVLEVNSDFAEGDFELLCDAARTAGRPLSLLLVQVDSAPDRWREILHKIEQARSMGVGATAQVGSRPIGVLMGLECSMQPFAKHPDWLALQNLTPGGRLARLLGEPELRRRLVFEHRHEPHAQWAWKALERGFELTDELDYEPPPGQAIAVRAERAGQDRFALALELMLARGGSGLILHPFENYCAGDLDVVRQMLVHPFTVCGVADAGAHVGIICDASSPTSLLAHWARDRRRGPRLPLEFLVRKQTRDTALHYGLGDRGLLAPGYRADFNVIDFKRLRLGRPELAYDLPAGGRRLVQKAIGYRHTFVAGEETWTDGEATSALPGRLLRGARPGPARAAAQ